MMKGFFRPTFLYSRKKSTFKLAIHSSNSSLRLFFNGRLEGEHICSDHFPFAPLYLTSSSLHHCCDLHSSGASSQRFEGLVDAPPVTKKGHSSDSNQSRGLSVLVSETFGTNVPSTRTARERNSCPSSQGNPQVHFATALDVPWCV